jgi:hypothetical protein
MDSFKRRKMSQDLEKETDKEAAMSPAVSDESQFLYEPKMFSHFLAFCDFVSLIALRSMSKTTKELSDKECVDRALKALPMESSYHMETKPIEYNTCMKVKLGWQVDTTPEAMAKSIVGELCYYETEETKQDAIRLLVTTGQFDTKDLEGGDPMQSKEYIQRPYAGYTKYKYTAPKSDGKVASRSEGDGAAILYEESIRVEKALALVNKMLWAMTEAEATDFNYYPYEKQTKISTFRMNLFTLLVMAKATSIHHGYIAVKERDFHEPHGQRNGTLQFLTSDGEEIEVAFDFSF